MCARKEGKEVPGLKSRCHVVKTELIAAVGENNFSEGSVEGERGEKNRIIWCVWWSIGGARISGPASAAVAFSNTAVWRMDVRTMKNEMVSLQCTRS